ncbi:hypothetical protein FQA39_LY01363 [Lamprigera yunnana]|nr:hypothetical protein FQA39_LY01363 [Lamprigera yunnana]
MDHQKANIGSSAAPSLYVSITCPWDITALFEIERSEARSKPTEDIVGGKFNQDIYIQIMLKFKLMHMLFYIIIELASSVAIGATVSMSDTERKYIPLPPPSSHSDEVAPSFSKEKDARVQKLHQATEQQELLFSLRKQILEEEPQWAVEERAAAKKKAELEFQKAAEILD